MTGMQKRAGPKKTPGVGGTVEVDRIVFSCFFLSFSSRKKIKEIKARKHRKPFEEVQVLLVKDGTGNNKGYKQ